ncbi:hypothetical protein GCM10009730_52840 [Streptomyces albidochromogenes]
MWRAATATSPSANASESASPRRTRAPRRSCSPRCDGDDERGVPPHLLVDRETSSLTLFGEPEGDDYRQLSTVPFGKPFTLPDPFGFDLETAAFV